MKLFIVILVVLGVGYIGLTVYGVKRDDPPKSERSGAPPWLSGSIGAFATSHAPKVQFDPPTMQVSSAGAVRRVPAADSDLPQIVRATLVTGSLVLVTAHHESGKADDIVCICRPGTDRPALPLGMSCPDRQPMHCPDDGDVVVVPFDRQGGTLLFQAPAPAEVAL